MPTYSHSQLSTYEDCPLKFKLHYRDRIKRDVEGVEAFLGSRVHDVLEKCYEDASNAKGHTLPELLAFYDDQWQREWHDKIVVTNKDMAEADYKTKGRRMIESFYRRYAPFDADVTVDTEMNLSFSLGDENSYRMTGFIDRLAKTPDGVWHIHDYKTSSHLPGQAQADSDRQLGLYQIGVQKRWPHVKAVRLVWHYLSFDQELVSSRTPQRLADLAESTRRLIDEIEAAGDFPPRESPLCGWCEYPDLCPTRKHFHIVESLPPNEFLGQPGVALVNKFAELKETAAKLSDEAEKVREAIIEYARQEGVTNIRGSDRQARVKFDQKLKFPGKNDREREGLEEVIVQAGKWDEVSQLDAAALARAVESGEGGEDVTGRVMAYGQAEETATVYLSKLKEREK